jgi:hypothetical protein
MRLAVRAPAVQRILSLTGIDRLVDIYPSVKAALADPTKNSILDEQSPIENADTDGGAA